MFLTPLGRGFGETVSFPGPRERHLRLSIGSADRKFALQRRIRVQAGGNVPTDPTITIWVREVHGFHGIISAPQPVSHGSEKSHEFQCCLDVYM